MNEFTKEELEDIAEMMRHARQQGIDTIHDLTYEIEVKVRKMIENYCEHDRHETSALINYCYKCNHSEFIGL